jgi:hypothetical protein
MFNMRNQSSHEESHVSKCQSLLSRVQSDMEFKKWKLIIRIQVSQVRTSKSQSQSKITCDNPHEVKKK